MHRLLIVEDDLQINEMIQDFLRADGFEVYSATHGIEAVQLLEKESFDVVILDLMIPYLSGMQVMKKLREHSNAFVIILSAKDSEADKAKGLMLGADDYMTKPFSLIELSARIKAHLRRSDTYGNLVEPKSEPTIVIRDLTLYIDQYTLTKNGVPITLTSKEFDILKLLASNPNKVFTKQQIYTSCWDDVYHGDDNVINVHIRRLREKIEDDTSNPTYIKTQWGIGYKLED